MHRVLLSALAVFLATSGCSGGSSGDDDDDGGPVAEMLRPIREEYELPGIAAAIHTTAGMAAIGVAGVRRAEHDPEIEAGDRWHLGSCTKAMTATVYATLVEDGLLSFGTTLEDAFPAMTIDSAYRAVTMAQLFAHRGGAPEVIPTDTWNALWVAGDVVAQRATFAADILGAAPANTPGTAFLYSNAGYMIAGAAMELETGDPWETLMQERLFDPLGMTSCGFGPPAGDGEMDAPWGHQANGTPVAPESVGSDNPPAVGPAGTVHCSLEDWGKFAMEHARGAKGNGVLLEQATYAQLHTPLGDDYAMGWGAVSRPWADGIALTHSGSNTMFFATVWVAPEIGVAYTAATNIADSGAPYAIDDAISGLIALEE